MLSTPTRAVHRSAVLRSAVLRSAVLRSAVLRSAVAAMLALPLTAAASWAAAGVAHAQATDGAADPASPTAPTATDGPAVPGSTAPATAPADPGVVAQPPAAGDAELPAEYGSPTPVGPEVPSVPEGYGELPPGYQRYEQPTGPGQPAGVAGAYRLGPDGQPTASGEVGMSAIDAEIAAVEFEIRKYPLGGPIVALSVGGGVALALGYAWLMIAIIDDTCFGCDPSVDPAGPLATMMGVGALVGAGVAVWGLVALIDRLGDRRPLSRRLRELRRQRQESLSLRVAGVSEGMGGTFELALRF